MTERTRVWRWTDLVGLVGVVLLLFGAPAIAQAADEGGPLGGGRTFTTPFPHVGDHVEYDLVLDDKTGSPRVLKSILTVDRYAVEPGEVPADVAFAERRSYAHLDVNEENLSVRMFPAEIVEYYDESGFRTYMTFRGMTINAHQPGNVSYVEHEGHTDTLAYTTGNGRFGARYEYSPDLVGDIKVEVFPGGASDIDEWRTKVVRYRLEYQSREFYGAHHGARTAALDQLQAAFDPPDREKGDCILERVPMFHPGFSPYLDAHWDLGGRDCDRTAATMFGPDHVGFAGTHEDLLRGGEIIASMDLLPGVIVAGNGPRISMEDRYAPSGFGGFRSRTIDTTEADANRTPLRAMDGLTAPLLRDVGFADLRKALSSAQAPDDVRVAMSKGAVITGFRWMPAPIEQVDTANVAAVAASQNTTRDQDHAQEHRTQWNLALTQPDGWTMAIVLVMVDGKPGGSIDIESIELCDDASCGPRALDPAILDIEVVDLDALLAGVRREIAAHEIWNGRQDPVQFEFPPVQAMEGHKFVSILPRNWTGWTHGLPDWRLPMDHRFEPRGPGLASWDMRARPSDPETGAHSGLAGAVEMTAGRTLYRAAWMGAEASAPGWGRESSLVATTDTVQLRQAPAALPALIGLGLVLTAAFARIWAALTAGIHFPVVTWLYAKVRNADVLVNERRAAIMAAIHAEQGLTASDVARRLGYGWGSTVHHLQRLVQADLLRVVVDGRHRYYVPAGQEASVAARPVSRQRLLAAIEANPGATAAELARALDRRRASVARLAARLVRANLVTRERDGRKVRFHPVPPQPPEGEP